MKRTITIFFLALALMSTGGADRSSGAAEPLPASAPVRETVWPQQPLKPPEEEEAGDFSSFNSLMHDFNLWVWQKADATSDWLILLTPPSAARKVTGNLLLNYVNEPVSMLSWAVAGDFAKAAVSAERFWVNTTQGWLGIEDVATASGLVMPQIDIGLALCARGVGEGGYVVLPFVGPRTVRDGLADFVLFNAITYAALAPVLGFPPSLESIAVVEVIEEAGRISFMRQIDHGDDLNTSQAAVRKQYLFDRRRRCDEIIAGRDNGAKSGAHP
jgi:phospholipid-binding lipoprotein MlaA